MFLDDGWIFQLRETPERPVAALIAIFILLLVIAEAIYWVMRWADHNSERMKGLVYGFLLVSLFVPLNHLRAKLGILGSLRNLLTSFVPAAPFTALFGLLLLFSTLILWFCTTHSQAAEKVTKRLGIILSPFIFVCLGNGFWTAHIAPAPIPRPTMVMDKQSRLSKEPRILWIIFDELDQRLAFEERPADVKLPEFERVRSLSVTTTHALPAGTNTLESIPSLLTGQSIQSATPIFPADLYLTINSGKRNSLWSTEPTIFTKTKQLGLHTGLLGWYHAYCSIIGKDIDLCHRRSHFDYSDNILEDLSIIVRNIFFGNWFPAMFVDDYKKMTTRAQSMASNPSLDLVFMHLPIPHSPWIYDRKKGGLTIFRAQSVEGYFDNLVLADKQLGLIRETMEKENQWKNTVIIISSDHSWRRSSEYDQKRDFRVPFSVRMPDEISIKVNANFETPKTKDLILAIFENKVRTSKDVADWLQNKSVQKQEGSK